MKIDHGWKWDGVEGIQENLDQVGETPRSPSLLDVQVGIHGEWEDLMWEWHRYYTQEFPCF